MGGWLTRACPAWIALAVAALIGAIYALVLFGPAFLLGTAPFWLRPRGYMGGQLDMPSVLAAYDWFAADAWRWKLLRLPLAGWPEGSNAFGLDVAPLVAIAGKLASGVVGRVVNPYPAWHLLTFVLASVALTALVRALGQRSLAGAILAGGLGAMSPMLHFRFGHMAHLAHWLPILSLALYFARDARGRFAGLLSLCLLAGAVNLYLYVMVAAVAAAAVLQDFADRRIALPRAALLVLAIPGSGFLPVWAFGLLDLPGLTSGVIDFGFFSMNLLSPAWPQVSGALQWTGIPALTGGPLDGTDGQYEGYAYLGLGALLVVPVALWRGWGSPAAALRRHWALAVALAVLTIWALGNEVYAAKTLVFGYPMPQFLLDTVLAWFRSSGRFFWPVAWLILAYGIAGALRRATPRAAAVLVLAALALQWVDLSLWRTRIATLIAAPEASVFGAEAEAVAIERDIARRGAVAVIPSFFCSSSADNYEGIHNIAASEVQSMAARGNARMRWIMLARGTPDCEAQKTADLGALAGEGVLVLLRDPTGIDRTAEARGLPGCREFPLGVVCPGPQ